MNICAWKPTADGLLLKVRATPKAGREAIEGIVQLADGTVALKARVRAAAADGKANRALIELIARAAKLPPSTLALAAGTTSRLKTIRISGDPQLLAIRLHQAFGRRERPAP